MDASIERTKFLSRSEVDRLFGSYKETTPITSYGIQNGLISRQYLYYLATMQLEALIQEEFSSTNAFLQVHGDKKVSLMSVADGFSFNTPSYFLVKYGSEVSPDKRRARLAYFNNTTEQNVSRSSQVRYILVSKAINDSPRLSFVDLTLEIGESGSAHRSAVQYIPDEEEYYSALSNVEVWRRMSRIVDNLIVKNAKEKWKQYEELVETRPRLQAFIGRITEHLEVRDRE